MVPTFPGLPVAELDMPYSLWLTDRETNITQAFFNYIFIKCIYYNRFTSYTTSVNMNNSKYSSDVSWPPRGGTGYVIKFVAN